MMGTNIRPKVSDKNPYYLDPHRFYELKHFCRQYPTWKKARAALTGLSARPADLALFNKPGQESDPTARSAEARAYYTERMAMVEQAAYASDPDLASYILTGVTEGLPYAALRMQCNIPCGKDMYYNRYRKFFWLLSKARD